MPSQPDQRDHELIVVAYMAAFRRKSNSLSQCGKNVVGGRPRVVVGMPAPPLALSS